MQYLLWEELIKQTHVFEYLPGLLFDVLFNTIRDVMEKQLEGGVEPGEVTEYHGGNPSVIGDLRC